MAVTDITVGAPATIKIGALAAVEGDCVSVGTTEGGVKLNHTQELFDVKADQYVGTLRQVITGEDCLIEFNVAEATLANIAYAFGYPTAAVVGTTLSFGGSSTVTERIVYINCNFGATASRKITLYKCVLQGSTEVSMVKSDKTLVKLTLKVLQDTSKSVSAQFGTIVDSSTDTTPPTVAMTTPVEDGTVTKDAKGAVTLTFTEATNQIDEGTLIYGNSDDATIMIVNVTDTTVTALVEGTISYSAATKVLTFTPTNNWTASDKLQIIITAGVKDTAGNRLASIFFGHFTVTA